MKDIFIELLDEGPDLPFKIIFNGNGFRGELIFHPAMNDLKRGLSEFIDHEGGENP